MFFLTARYFYELNKHKTKTPIKITKTPPQSHKTPDTKPKHNTCIRNINHLLLSKTLTLLPKQLNNTSAPLFQSRQVLQ